VTGFKGKNQRFQRLLETSEDFACVQLDSESLGVFVGAPEVVDQPNFQKNLLFAPNFFLDEGPSWYQFNEYFTLPISEAETACKNFLKTAAPFEFQWEEPDFTDFSSQVRAIEAAFHRYEIEKAVPTVFAKADRAENVNFPTLFAYALVNRGKSSVYAFITSNDGVVGATPELLFDMNLPSRSLKTMALAGTRATEEEATHPLLQDHKELHEHNLVILDIKQKLKRFGEVSSGLTETWNLGKITHLRTDIECLLSLNKALPDLFVELIETLHPTPALGLSSEKLDYRWLKTLHGAKERFRFGAPFGIWNPELGDVIYVAIRNIQ